MRSELAAGFHLSQENDFWTVRANKEMAGIKAGAT
jgi:hypothetical protein